MIEYNVNMDNEILSQAIQLIKTGRKAEAKKKLESFLRSNRHNIAGWLWYAEIWSTYEQKIKALELGLRQNPDNPKLMQAIETLRSRNIRVASENILGEAKKKPNLQLTKKCPYCAETIKSEAIVCRFCGRDLRTGQHPGSHTQIRVPKQKEWNPGVAALLSLIIPGAGSIYKGQVSRGISWLILTAIGYALFVIPGIFLHIMTIADAHSGNPYKAGG